MFKPPEVTEKHEVIHNRILTAGRRQNFMMAGRFLALMSLHVYERKCLQILSLPPQKILFLVMKNKGIRSQLTLDDYEIEIQNSMHTEIY